MESTPRDLGISQCTQGGRNSLNKMSGFGKTVYLPLLKVPLDTKM